MGYISKLDWQHLEIEKPEKIDNMYHAIMGYMKESGLNTGELSNINYNHIRDYDKLSDQIYAKNIEIVSSGNEPKIYAYVMDNNENVLFVAGLLDTSPEAYAKVASYAGFFLEKFNLYIDINFNFK